MGRAKRETYAAYIVMAAEIDPLMGEVAKVKLAYEHEMRAVLRRIEIEKNASIRKAWEAGLKKNSICSYFGVTAGHAQDALMEKALGTNWAEISVNSGVDQFLKPYRVGDWWVERDFIDEGNYVNDSDSKWFTAGSLWRDDAPDMVYTFSMRDGVKYAVEMFHPDGVEVDMTAHFGYHLVWPRTATDDGTVYEVGGKGKWFVEDVEDDVFGWLTNGYTQRKAGWPSRPKG